MGLPTWGGFLGGIAFVAAGIFFILLGTKTLAVDRAPVRAPSWMLTVAGVTFALGGLAIWGQAWKQHAAERQRLQATRQHPDEPALADYPWHPGGFEVSAWTGAAKAVGLAIGVSMFLSVLNWWAFGKLGSLMVKAVVGLFDCAAVAMWWHAERRLASAFKFGNSRIAFTRFPYRLGEPVVIRWHPSDRISQVNKGTFTLRCVEERTESRGRGKRRSVVLIQEEVWSGKWVMDQPRKLQVKDAVELHYELPPDGQPTRLSDYRPVFWELEVRLDLPGLDFRESYLVPIYAGKPACLNSSPALAPVPATA
jgi:hypothetical protein